MTAEEIKQEYLRQLQKVNAIKANANNAFIGNVTSFVPNTADVTMPVAEYKVLIDAQDALKDMLAARGLPEPNRLKLFHVFVTWPGPMAVNSTIVDKVEMTILDTNEDDAVKEVKRILEYDAYDDLDKTLIRISQIHGPFEKGFVISRIGG